MLSTEDFAGFGSKVVLFSHITSRLPDAAYPNLLSEKGGSGFPYLAYLDAEGNVIGKPAGRSVEAFQETLDGPVAEFLALQAKAADGDADAQRELFVRKVELGHFAGDPAAARARLEGMDGIDEATRERLGQALTEQEFQQILGSVSDASQAAAAGAKVAEMFRAGRIATGSTSLYYWFFLGSYAEDQKDAELLGAVVENLRGNQRAARLLPRFEQALEALKKDG